MIIKSSNQPIIIETDADANNYLDIRVTLWDRDTLLKEWSKDELIITEKNISASLTQKETAAFPEGKARLEVKWLNGDGLTEFAEDLEIPIIKRSDLKVMEAEV